MTTMAKKETVQRKWYVLDAAGKPLGRTAVTAAKLLRGKHKVDFTPNVDCGDFVIIVNVDKAVLTGKKARRKALLSSHRLDWQPEGCQVPHADGTSAPSSRWSLPSRACCPRTPSAAPLLTRLKLYKGAEHNNAAQKPEAWTLD